MTISQSSNVWRIESSASLPWCCLVVSSRDYTRTSAGKFRHYNPCLSHRQSPLLSYRKKNSRTDVVLLALTPLFFIHLRRAQHHHLRPSHPQSHLHFAHRISVFPLKNWQSVGTKGCATIVTRNGFSVTVVALASIYSSQMTMTRSVLRFPPH